jgi:hypothetical protein
VENLRISSLCFPGKFKNPSLPSKAMEFDPIRQHRHFCPWIASEDDGEPGWKQTLSALYRPKEHLPHSPNTSPSSMAIMKVFFACLITFKFYR